MVAPCRGADVFVPCPGTIRCPDVDGVAPCPGADDANSDIAYFVRSFTTSASIRSITLPI